MTSAVDDRRAARWYGIGFSVLFVGSLTALLGELVGAFADAAETFSPYFDTTHERLRHALGAYLLTAAGLAFLAFTVRITALGGDRGGSESGGRTARLVAAVFAALVALAAAALATVSLSIGFGKISGDPGIRDGQHLLPQLGYVGLMVPAAIAAGYAVWLIARVAARSGILPAWMVVAGYVVAVLQLFSFYSLPLFGLPLWVLAASLSVREASQ